MIQINNTQHVGLFFHFFLTKLQFQHIIKMELARNHQLEIKLLITKKIKKTVMHSKIYN